MFDDDDDEGTGTDDDAGTTDDDTTPDSDDSSSDDGTEDDENDGDNGDESEQTRKRRKRESRGTRRDDPDGFTQAIENVRTEFTGALSSAVETITKAIGETNGNPEPKDSGARDDSGERTPERKRGFLWR